MIKLKEGYDCPLLKKNCLEMSCAWWVVEENMCAITSVSRALNTQKKLV